MSKSEYIKEILAMMKRTDDLTLLCLIYSLMRDIEEKQKRAGQHV